jgi:hypothetical protein
MVHRFIANPEKFADGAARILRALADHPEMAVELKKLLAGAKPRA